MKVLPALVLLLSIAGGCGGGDSSPPSRTILPTTTAAAEYFDATAKSTHDAYEQDVAELRTILETDEEADPAYARQMQLELIITDSRVLPLTVVEYVEELPGKKSRRQLISVFEDARVAETAFYTEKLQELYDLWEIPLPEETVQALQAAIADNYHDIEKEL